MKIDTRNTQFDAVDRAYRKQYIGEKMRALRSLMNTYASSTKYIGSRLVGSRYEFTPRYTNLIIADAFKSIKETQGYISKSYTTEIERINSLGIQNIETNLRVAGATLSDDLLTSMAGDPLKLALNQVYSADIGLSKKIWAEEDRIAIARIIQRGIQDQKSPFEVAEMLTNYMLEGKGFYNAYRLAFTEITWAFNNAKIKTIQDWNNNPISDFEIGVKQYLSPYHNIYDICDVLGGTYTADTAPKIPRHPNCECGQKFVIIDGKTSKEIKNHANRLLNDMEAYDYYQKQKQKE